MGLSSLAGEAILVLMLIAFAAIWAILHVFSRSMERARAIREVRAEMAEIAQGIEAEADDVKDDAEPLRAAA